MARDAMNISPHIRSPDEVLAAREWDVPVRVKARFNGGSDATGGWWLDLEYALREPEEVVSGYKSDEAIDAPAATAATIWGAFRLLGQTGTVKKGIDGKLAKRAESFVRRFGALTSPDGSVRPRYQPVAWYVHCATIANALVKATRAMKRGERPMSSDVRMLRGHLLSLTQFATDRGVGRRVLAPAQANRLRRWGPSLVVVSELIAAFNNSVASKPLSQEEKRILADVPLVDGERKEEERAWLQIQRDRVATVLNWWELQDYSRPNMVSWPKGKSTPMPVAVGEAWSAIGRELRARALAVEVSDGVWLQCANPDCERTFKSRRRRAGKSERRGEEKSWCSLDECQKLRNRYKVAEYRKRQREEAQKERP